MCYFQNEMHIFGLRRSGTHAITFWLTGHFCKTIYKNDVAADINQGIYKFSLFENGKFSKDFERLPNEKYEALMLGKENRSALDAYSEIKSNEYHNSINSILNRSAFSSFSKNKYVVSVLRDPYNYVASSAKLWGNEWPAKSGKKLLYKWKDSAIDFLKGPDKIEDFKIIRINFNKWFSDTSYRKNISRSFNLEFNDRNKNEVSGYGGGSSFDRLSKRDHAEDMNVLYRWKIFKDQPNFQSAFKDDVELKNLSEQIFDFSLEF